MEGKANPIPSDVGKHEGRDGPVVVAELSFGDCALREEHLLRVRDSDLARVLLRVFHRPSLRHSSGDAQGLRMSQGKLKAIVAAGVRQVVHA